LGGELGVREESKDTEPVVDCDEDDAFGRERRSVVALLVARAGEEAAAVDPEHHRDMTAPSCRCPHGEGQAVLALGGALKQHVRKRVGLNAATAELRSRSHTLPRERGLWGRPALGWRSVGNAEKGANARFRGMDAFDHPLCDAYPVVVRRLSTGINPGNEGQR